MSQNTIRVNEIFGPTIQGEGALIGQPTVFVRTGGCDYRCSWCDTLHAVDSDYRDEWQPMTAESIMMQVEILSGAQPLMISLSGGNPAIQPLGYLIELGKRDGYRFALETQGSIARDWFSKLDVLTLSPKAPSSGMETDWQKLAECVEAAAPRTRTVMKVVIFDEQDYAYARDVASRYPDLPLFLQPGNHTPPAPGHENGAIDMTGIMHRMRWLVDRVTADRLYSATVLPQLHTLIWGNLRGV
ncbi:MAG: 7-carboxy-7-deazaguanine synthase QueE [Roseibium sp.]|uniref:7-carboxy-7-deazaguanine synthase QueE n=1 Tax=Roseibium sp. TaxID=1936156 RepID=UPI001B10F69E|nr:7-carboxy-7-deazaguanine synthase QueE [Roseibium sp.]MBO6510065.1 7-carboxy-7-deazaguanine synthase QueE [Roseibium sp.]MBO6892179.1 7-carboxy-7-deazaguanine synthase QueE [Roseibium sp.]MBO6931014.1 7-carboxy-7-deazaguanine synthase QueE [Roseibium sp.]